MSVKGEGRLVEPNRDFVEICGKCDVIFDNFHGRGVRNCQDPLGKVKALILAKHPSFPPKIVDLFCKVKFSSRIRDLNNKIKMRKINRSVRSFKQTAQFVN